LGSNCWLWLARYGDEPQPNELGPWDKWTFWQYTSNGEVSGIEDKCDRDKFYGDQDQFDAFLAENTITKEVSTFT